jgi:hypothetical protein
VIPDGNAGERSKTLVQRTAVLVAASRSAK